MSLSLMMSLGACSTNPTPVPVTPPASLMAPCPETPTAVDIALVALEAGLEHDPVTNADLVRKIRQLRVDLRNCNADKAALRDWSAEMED